MPYKKRKQKCKQSDGDHGSYVLSYTDKKGKKHRACHTSKKKMQGQIAAIEAESKVIKITRDQLRQLIREALEIHHAPEDLDNMGPEEAYGMGYLKGQDMQCDHPDWSPSCVQHDLHSDDPDLDDDGFLSVAELVNMVHNMTDDLHEQADRNRDGTLDADELRALADDIEDEVPQIDMRLVDDVMDYIEDHYNKARFDGRYIIGIAPATGPDGRPTQDIKKFDAAVSKRTLMRNVRNWLGY